MSNDWEYSNPEMKAFRWIGVLREEWYSICSEHFGQPQEGCDCCAAGHWVNIVQAKAESLWHQQDPVASLAWANRRESGIRQRLGRFFPNLRYDQNV